MHLSLSRATVAIALSLLSNPHFPAPKENLAEGLAALQKAIIEPSNSSVGTFRATCLLHIVMAYGFPEPARSDK